MGSVGWDCSREKLHRINVGKGNCVRVHLPSEVVSGGAVPSTAKIHINFLITFFQSCALQAMLFAREANLSR